MKYYENETIDTKILIYPKDKKRSNKIKINELFKTLEKYEEESLFVILTKLLKVEDIDSNISIDNCFGTIQTVVMFEDFEKGEDVICITQSDYGVPHIKIWKNILDKLYPKLGMVFMFKDNKLNYLGTNDRSDWFFKHYMCHVKLSYSSNINPSLCEKIGEDEIKKLSESGKLLLIRNGGYLGSNGLEYEAYFKTFKEMKEHLKNTHGYIIEKDETLKESSNGDFILTTKAFQYNTLNSLG